MIDPNAIRRAWPTGSAPEMATFSDGWPARMFEYLTPALRPRGSILCQGGRGDFLEKYLECFANWHDAGWNVGGFDWRGQAGSGRFLDDPSIGHVHDFAQWIEDLATYFTVWQSRTPGPHIVMGHSMGGHLVLRALIEARIAPDAVVLISPLLGFDTRPVPVAVSAGLVRLAARLGRSEKPAWKSNERPASSRISRQSFLTHDADRYGDELWWRAQNPVLALGPPSINWLRQAHASNKRISAPGAPEGIATPVLIIGTDGDKLVSPRAIRSIAGRIPDAQLLMFGKQAAHEVLREADDVRDKAMGAIARFLAEKAPAR